MLGCTDPFVKLIGATACDMRAMFSALSLSQEYTPAAPGAAIIAMGAAAAAEASTPKVVSISDTCA